MDFISRTSVETGVSSFAGVENEDAGATGSFARLARRVDLCLLVAGGDAATGMLKQTRVRWFDAARIKRKP